MSFLNDSFTTDQRKLAAWSKAMPLIGKDARLVRRDYFGLFIYWHEYGNRKSAFGWEIDHIRPVALGGPDVLDNLRALHWQNNASLGGNLATALTRYRKRD